MENISREFINLCKGDGYRINAVIRRPPLQEKLSLLDTMKLVDYSSDSDSNDSDDNVPSPPLVLPSLQHATLCKGNTTGDTASWSAFEFQPQLVSVRISTPTERLN